MRHPLRRLSLRLRLLLLTAALLLAGLSIVSAVVTDQLQRYQGHLDRAPMDLRTLAPTQATTCGRWTPPGQSTSPARGASARRGPPRCTPTRTGCVRSSPT